MSAPDPLSQEWYEMVDLRRRRYATSVWVPLRISETIWSTGEYGRVGSAEEIVAGHSIAFPLSKRAEAEGLGWSDIGVGHRSGPFAYRNGGYKPAEVYRYDDDEDLGVEFVFVQSFPGDDPSIWHLSQDVVLALGLKQEGDCWVRPSEGYVEVARQRRDANGKFVAIEIRSEFLRDYLAARGLALRVSYYRQRMAVVPTVGHLAWRTDGIDDDKPHDRFKASVFEVDSEGGPPGGVAVFQMWRTDVDEHEDVPVFGDSDDDNVGGASRHFERKAHAYRVEGELWRAEWIEPGPRSVRVRGDEEGDSLFYVVDAAGAKLSDRELDDEDVGRWLWFNPRVINALLSKRGSSLDWYTRETGGISSSPDYSVHFGVNEKGLITVYAHDVASLDRWQQQIWHGHNVAPEGGVSRELLSAQMRTIVADTIAPEAEFVRAQQHLDTAMVAVSGEPLFGEHSKTGDIARSIHRFRAVDHDSLLALAKDIARIVVDRMSVSGPRRLAEPPKGEKWGSLKSLEKALATRVGDTRAHEVMGPLFGVYELRLGDAHLPSEELGKALKLVGVDASAPFVDQGARLIGAAADALRSVAKALNPSAEKRVSS